MNGFKKIIGYESIKNELMQIADIYNHRGIYSALGAKPPKGLLLHGVPGVGKSLMVAALIEAIGQKCFVCRKDKPDGEFVNEIRAAFKNAASSAPSIILLDDMDKFSDTDEYNSNAEEYITVQSCIDDVRDKEVFVIATANSLKTLPRSLIRSRRFDRHIFVPTPSDDEAKLIIEHYLSGMKVSHDLDTDSIARMMQGRSCADLETIINEAAIYAGNYRADAIGMEHFMKAAMSVLFNIPYSSINSSRTHDRDDALLMKIAYHEAGHAVVREILDPGSIVFVSVYSDEHDNSGVTEYANNIRTDMYKREKTNIISALAGMAAVEQRLGIFETGAKRDLENAYDGLMSLITRAAACGFSAYGCDYDRSPELRSRQEQAAAAEMEKYYRKAKEIIAENSELFERIALALMDNKYLTAADIRDIKRGCRIVYTAI